MRTRRDGFTLIELLVVVSIVSILAAVLFPVFARGKEGAKKAVSIANVMQFSSAVLLYASDHDDKYPRADGCQPYSSINPDLNKPGAFSGDGCTPPGPYAWRLNHYSWQKWVYPYIGTYKNFLHPRWEEDWEIWRRNGEIFNGYAINLALTGAINTYGNPFRNGAYRNSFLGGSPSTVPDPSSAMLFMEFVSNDINFAPVFATPNANVQTAYPAAIRELWAPMFMKWRSSSDCTPTDDVDLRLVSFGDGIIIGRVDGSAKWYAIRRFLAETPTRNDYVVGSYASGWECGPTNGSRTINAPPTWTTSWPLWALD